MSLRVLAKMSLRPILFIGTKSQRDPVQRDNLHLLEGLLRLPTKNVGILAMTFSGYLCNIKYCHCERSEAILRVNGRGSPAVRDAVKRLLPLFERDRNDNTSIKSASGVDHETFYNFCHSFFFV